MEVLALEILSIPRHQEWKFAAMDISHCCSQECRDVKAAIQ